jgi:hypothetical protein
VIQFVPSNTRRKLPPPAPRIAVRLHTFAPDEPHGRSRAFHITEHDLGELLRNAVEMEARR